MTMDAGPMAPCPMVPGPMASGPTAPCPMAPCPRSPLTPRFAAAAAAVAALAAALLAPAARAEEPAVEAAHYRLFAAAPPEEVEELGRLVEEAWKGFAAFFGKQPKLAEGQKLTVRMLATAEEWERAIRADGTGAPRGAGGYYWPGSRTAYLFRQPTLYYTRVLLLHEMAHQFHFLARTNNKAPTADWYAEGIVEHLSWHHWDGERLLLGVLPLLSLEDRAAGALAVARAPDFDLARVVEGEVAADRPIAWALFRFLATGDKGKPLRRFDAFCRKMDAGGAAGPAFRGQFGPPKALQERFVEWLAAEQQPWTPVFNQWEPLAPGVVRGVAPVMSLCRSKAALASVRATLHLPAEARFLGGLILHFADAENYTVALLDRAGGLAVNRRAAGGWSRLFAGDVGEGGGEGRVLEAVRRGESVEISVDGKACAAFEFPPSPMGLALDGSDLRFTQLSWR
ncbi:MAG: hypothetical protein ACT4PV_09485 [Planctomycetaceae bacterium]